MWLAQVGRERIEETIDPELTIDRALDTYLKKGYSEDWIHQRLLSIRVRNELTTEWKQRGGNIAGNARKELEEELGESVVTSKNASQLNTIVSELIEATTKERE